MSGPSHWRGDRELDPAIAYTEPPRPGPPRRALLTGATGLLGAFVLRELLRDGDAEVLCLVRAADPRAATRRLLDHLARLGLADPASSGRISAVVGDLERPALGLSPRDFAALADGVDIIYHCAVRANFAQPYAALRATNVLGTAELLRLAGAGATRPFHHVSTLAVFFDQVARGAARIGERDEPAPSDELRSGYVRSKHVAELLVQAAARRGLPATIYRTSRLGGDSRTGATSNDRDLIVGLLRACVLLGEHPALDFEVALAPVDWAARALVSLSRRPDCAGRAYHLVQPRPVAWSALVAGLRACGHPLTATDYASWRARLKRTAETDHPERAALARLWIALAADDTLLAPRPAHETPDSGPHLAAAGLACPPIDAPYLARWLAYLQRGGLLPPAQNV